MTPSPAPSSFLWIPDPPSAPDQYAAFRGTFSGNGDTELSLTVFGAHWFNVWLDGELVAEGPARFDVGHPEYETRVLRVSRGSHCLSALVHHVGVSTRILRADLIAPFFAARLDGPEGEVPLSWRCRGMEAYRATGVRVNPQLGWIEWCDQNRLPRGWKETGFDDSGWASPAIVNPEIGELRPLSIGHVRVISGCPELLAKGYYTGTTDLHVGSAGEDIHIGLLRRDLAADVGHHDGVWRRYDLGQVRLARPRFTLDLPAGAHVEFIYSETLSRGAVSPLIPLSCGTSCNMDHYTASGGEEEFCPLTPKGLRFLEVHVSGAGDDIRFLREEYLERSFFDRPGGSFSCDDLLLNRIWTLGVTTLRGCTEDAVTDNPTRERGQWTGDVVTVGMDLMASAHNDLRLIARGLRQSAWCAAPSGIVAGLCPGGATYLSTYALQWIPAVVHYHELTADRDLLMEMYPFAVGNLSAFEEYIRDGFLRNPPETWMFVDWGYQPPAEGPDLALNLHLLDALGSMARWAGIAAPDEGSRYEKLQSRTRDALRPIFAAVRTDGDFDRIGYHATALAFHGGLWNREQEGPALEALKRHMLSCFPNDPTAPRLSDSSVQNRRLITPYFAHYAFPPLIERGGMDFVLDQYRTCWGYALEEGRTTMIEVFDPNWSHCHQWACSPTWQLSRYVLGLHPRFDLGARHYVLNLRPGSLRRARGTVPIIGEDEVIAVGWSRNVDGVDYEVRTEREIIVHLTPDDGGTEVRGVWRHRLDDLAHRSVDHGQD